MALNKPSLSFAGGKIVIEESLSAKSKGLFYTCTMCMQKNIELPIMPERPRLISSKVSRDLSFATKNKQQKILQKNSLGRQKVGILLPKGGNCHSHAIRLYKLQKVIFF